MPGAKRGTFEPSFSGNWIGWTDSGRASGRALGAQAGLTAVVGLARAALGVATAIRRPLMPMALRPWGPEGLDLDEGLARVRWPLDRMRDKETETFAFVAPKTRTSRRDVPLRPSDVALLKRHRLAGGRPGDGERCSPTSAAGR
jgi:hypothetical protein